jgi:nucleolar protein 53
MAMAKTTTTTTTTKKKKSSRKGTKAWRSNISTAEEDDFAQRSARDERSGGSLAALPDETLFFVDKSSG